MDLKDHVTGEITTESYDKLVLSPGAAPIRPPLPGIDLPGIYSVRTVPDARAIREWLDRDAAEQTGMNSYTGMQTVLPAKPRRRGRRRLHWSGDGGKPIHRGLEVTLVERLNQVMPPLDPEMARLVERYMVRHGVQLELNDGVAGFEQAAPGGADLRPTVAGSSHQLRQAAAGGHRDPRDRRASGDGAGEDGRDRYRAERGGIRVDEQMRTSDPDIFAVGDAVEVKDFVTGQWSLARSPGRPTGRAGIAAEVIAGRNSRFRGTQGTSICQIFEGVIASTGASEKVLTQLGEEDFEKIYLYPNSHAGYYPGAKYIAMKVLFRKSDDAFSARRCSARTVSPRASTPSQWQSRRA